MSFKALELKIPPPVYFLIFAALMWLAKQVWPIMLFNLPAKPYLIGICIVIGISLDFTALSRFLLSKTTFNPMRPDKTQTLVTTGLYRYTRNPMYLGLFFLLSAWTIYIGALSALLLLPMFVMTITNMQIIPEERILTDLFGQDYIDYSQQVKRWL